MTHLFYFYIVFSYLFVIGVSTVTNMPWYNKLFAFFFFPIMLGRGFNMLVKNSNNRSS